MYNRRTIFRVQIILLQYSKFEKTLSYQIFKYLTETLKFLIIFPINHYQTMTSMNTVDQSLAFVSWQLAGNT